MFCLSYFALQYQSLINLLVGKEKVTKSKNVAKKARESSDSEVDSDSSSDLSKDGNFAERYAQRQGVILPSKTTKGSNKVNGTSATNAETSKPAPVQDKKVMMI